jgi:hypothetical protein
VDSSEVPAYLLLLPPSDDDLQDQSHNQLPHRTLSGLLPLPEEESGKPGYQVIRSYESLQPP